MGNCITYDKKSMDCYCSNGCMSVLMTVIGLSGSKQAQTDFEKNLIVWLMEKDQNVVGIGTVGFDITEMPWKKEYFQEQKEFMIQVLENVMNKIGWHTLNYEPNIEIIEDRVKELKRMFLQLQLDDIDSIAGMEWLNVATDSDPIKTGYPKCRKHGIYLSVFGCIACNDNIFLAL